MTGFEIWLLTVFSLIVVGGIASGFLGRKLEKKREDEFIERLVQRQNEVSKENGQAAS